MKNVTITLDEDTAYWARIEAAKAGKSLSKWIGEKLETEKQAPSMQGGFINGIGQYLRTVHDEGRDDGVEREEHFDRRTRKEPQNA